MTLALIDADIVAFRCAATCENDSEEFIPISRVAALVEQIIQDLKADEYQLFLTGRGNFRKTLYPAYKANRTKPPPRWLSACREYLIADWGANVTSGCEADDALGVESQRTPNSVVCSIDKDLLQIPGEHYNFVRKERSTISPERAFREFYLSLLIGDATDNIKGCPGIGKAKAPRLLEGCETADQMFETVRQAYNNDALMLLNGKLLWIWRKENDIWHHPALEPVKTTLHVEEFPLESMLSMEEEPIPSTALSGMNSKENGTP